MSYAERILEELKAKNADQPEFIQAATEILSTLGPALDAHPEYEENALLERFVEPERVVMFRVPWVIASSSTLPLAPTRAAFASTPRLRSAC